MFENLKVIELGMYLPLPYAGGFLSRLGAKVVKIEQPVTGDPLKDFDSSAYAYLNRGKEILYLDLKSEDDRKKIYEILVSADVVLNGFRRGFLKKAGLDYDAVKEKNPSCIYISLAGYEKGFKDADKAGHDLNFVAVSGIIHNLIEQGNLLPFQLADLAGALWAIIGVFYMLEKRRQTREGGELDLSLFRSLLSMFPFFYAVDKGSYIEKGIFTGKFACYNIYTTKDGKKIAFGWIEKKFFKRALDLLGLSYDEKTLYELNSQQYLIEAIAKVIKEQDFTYWKNFFENEDICVTPVYSKHEFYEYLKLQGVSEIYRENFLFSPISD